jgi:hypothetical protein
VLIQARPVVDTKAPGERAAENAAAAARRPAVESPAPELAGPEIQQTLADNRPGRAGTDAGGTQGAAGSPGSPRTGGTAPIRRQDLVALQRMAGNSAVAGFLGRPTVQRSAVPAAAPASTSASAGGDQADRRNPNITRAILAWQQRAPAPGPLAAEDRQKGQGTAGAAGTDSERVGTTGPAETTPDATAAEQAVTPGPTTPSAPAPAPAIGQAVRSAAEQAITPGLTTQPASGPLGEIGRTAGQQVATPPAPGIGQAVRSAAEQAITPGPTTPSAPAPAPAIGQAVRSAAEQAITPGPTTQPASGPLGEIGRTAGQQVATPPTPSPAANAGIGQAVRSAAEQAVTPGPTTTPTAAPAPASGPLGEIGRSAGQQVAAAPTPAPAANAGIGQAVRSAAERAVTPGPTTPQEPASSANAETTLPQDTITATPPQSALARPAPSPDRVIIPRAPERTGSPLPRGFREKRLGNAPGPGQAASSAGAQAAAAPATNLPGARGGNTPGGAGPGRAMAGSGAGARGGGPGGAKAGARAGGGGGAPKPLALNDPTLEKWRAAAGGAVEAVPKGDLGEAKDAASRVKGKGDEIDSANKADTPDFEADAKSKQPPMPQEPEKAQTLDTSAAESAVQAIADAGNKKLSTQTFPPIDFSTMPAVPEVSAKDFVPRTMTKAIADLEAKLAGKDLTPAERESLTKELEARKAKVAEIEAHAMDAPAQKPPSVEDKGAAKLEPLDPGKADLIGDAIARLLTKAPATAEDLVKKAVTSMKGDKVPRLKTDADAEKPTIQGDLESELQGIATEAGVTKEQLDAKVKTEQDAVKKAEEGVQQDVAAAGTDANKKVEDHAAEQGKQIAGAAKAVEAEVKQKQEAVKGPPDTAAIERKKTEFLKSAEDTAAQAAAALRSTSEKRIADLDAAATEQKGQVRSAVDTKATAIRRHFESDQAKADTTARTTLDWGRTAQGAVDTEAKKLKEAARKEVDGISEAIAKATTTGREAIRDWSARQVGTERSWWDRLMDMLEDWGSQAKANNAAWERQRNAESRDKMAGDFQLLTDLKTKEQTAGAAARDKEIARLSADQQALAKAYFGGQISGLDFVAQSTLARITARRAPEIAKKLEEGAIANWGAEELGQLAMASNPKFNAFALANKIRGAIAGPGTNEAQVFEGLGGARTAVERAALNKAYLEVSGGVSLQDDVKGDLGGHEKERAEAMMSGKSAEADAAALKEAMSGWGTDEEAMRNALRGKTPEELDAIKAEYRRMYGVDLKEDIDDDTDDAEQDNLMALADGDTDKADAAELEDAMSGPGTDEQKIQKVYERIRQEEEARAKAEGLSPAELKQRIAERNGRVAEKFKQYGDLSTKLTAEMADVDESSVAGLKDRGSKLVDTGDVKLIEALQSGDTTKIDAAKALREHESTYTSDDELEKIARNQAAKAELDVGLELASDKSRLKAQFEAGDLTADEYKAALGKWDEKAKTKDAMVTAKAKANMGELKDAYSKGTHGTQSFDQLIEDETSGYSNWELRELVQAGGKLSDEDELYFATAGAGTDEDKIKEVLKGKTPAEIEKIRKLYAEKHPGQTLDADIMEDVSGRENLDLGHQLQFGDPETFARQLAEAKDPIDRARIIAGMRTVLEERKSFEETGLIGSIFAETGDPLNSADQMEKALDRAITYDRELEAWEKKNPGKTPDAGTESPELAAARANFEMRYGGAMEAQEQVRAQIDSYTDAATQVGAAVVAVAVTVATLGSAGPIIAGLYGAMAAAAATMALKATLKGEAYGWEEMGVDAAVGAVDALVTVATAGIGKGVVAALEKAIMAQMAKAAAKQGGQSATKAAMKAWAKEALEEAIENAVQGMPSAFVEALLNDNTWKSDDPWGEIGKSTAGAAGMGAAMGVGMKGAGDLAGAAKKGLGGSTPKADVDAPAGTKPAGGGTPPPEPRPVDLPPEATPAGAVEKANAGELPPGAEGVDATKGGQLPESTVPDSLKAKAGADVDAEAKAKGGAEGEAAPGTKVGAEGGAATRSTGPDADAKSLGDTPPANEKPGGPSKEDVGKPLTKEDLADRYGMPAENVSRIQGVCDDLGIIVDVRPTTPYAEPMLRDGTALPKPEKVKAKTISETDVQIGLAKPEDLGKVGFFDPAKVEPRRPSNYDSLDADAKKKIDDRIKQRQEEFADFAKDMKKLQDAGLIRINDNGLVINTGLVNGKELPFTGDHDVFDIRAADGSKLSPAQYAYAKTALQNADAGVMHGAVTGWELDSPSTFHTEAGQKSYGKMTADHSPGGKEPLIRFGKGSPTAVWYEPATVRPDYGKAGRKQAARAAGRYAGSGNPDEEER